LQRTLIIAGGLGLMWSLCGHSAPDPLAEAFGRLPAMYGARLSPDGQFVSYLSTEGVALPVLFVTDEQGKVTPVLASKAGDFDIYWCGWANAERLLCGFYGINRRRSVLYPATRLVAVNRDGGNMRVLLQQRQQRRGQFAQFQDDIVDWLPDDPEHVLIEMPENSGTGVSRVNIYDGKAEAVERVRASVREWLSDGHGQPRMRMRMTQAHYVWEYRLPDDNDWQELYESRPGDDEDFYPLGFGEDRDVLLVMKPNLGRLALWEQDLSGEAGDQLVFAHPAVDAGGLLRIGKYRRLAGISYVTDSPQMHYFDAQAERIVGEVSQAKPGMQVSLVDESWDRSIYLMHIASPTDAGRYYRLDRPNRRLQAFWPTYPTLEKLTLGIMRPQPYKARDGVEIPAYLTLPASADARNLPAVLLPHGGPESRDHLAFNFLAQFLAARGYAVLQPNYRGSGGYGDDWVGEGGVQSVAASDQRLDRRYKGLD
jgi:dipeptidyl aminopeptidase/acylaminoacyl peptidase